jgi:hypothetical protein
VAEGAGIAREQFLVRRIVLIDEKLVREVETDPSKRIALAGRAASRPGCC